MLIRNYRLGSAVGPVRSPLCAALTDRPPPLVLVPRHQAMFATLFKARTRPFNVPKGRIFTIIIYDPGNAGEQTPTERREEGGGWGSASFWKPNEIFDRPSVGSSFLSLKRALTSARGSIKVPLSPFLFSLCLVVPR